MANSYIIYPADGVQTDWTVALAGGFLSRNDVFVQVITSGVPAAQAFTWISDTLIRVTPAVAAGKQVKIYRNTPKVVPLVDFSDGSIINEQNLDSSARQTLLAVAELADQSEITSQAAEAAEEAVATARAALASAEAALVEAEAAVAAVEGANTAAALATSAASAATIAANTATVAANAATTTSANAEAVAIAASNTANGIAGTANSALTAANSAVTTANAAQATANTAESTANGIAATANSALTTANSANTTANTANTTANSALSAAANPVKKIGASATASQNFTLTAEAANGTMKLARGNPGATTQDILTVSSAGVVQMPQNVVVFQAVRSADQAISGNAWTKAQCNDERLDVGSFYDNTTNYRFQPTVAGYYVVTCSTFMTGASAITLGISAIYKNGVEYIRSASPPGATYYTQASVTATVYLNGTDYVEFYVYCSGPASASLGASNGTSFSAYLLGAA